MCDVYRKEGGNWNVDEYGHKEREKRSLYANKYRIKPFSKSSCFVLCQNPKTPKLRCTCISALTPLSLHSEVRRKTRDAPNDQQSEGIYIVCSNHTVNFTRVSFTSLFLNINYLTLNA